MMPLLLAPANTDLRIVKIVADEKIKTHLFDLGITLDSIVRTKRNGKNVILIAKGVRLAIDNDILSRIYVA